MNDTILAREACQQTGLSSSTLARFAEAGYLKWTIIQGEPAYYISELQSTFGVKLMPSRIASEESAKGAEVIADEEQPSPSENIITAELEKEVPSPEIKHTQEIEVSRVSENSLNTREYDQQNAKTEMEIFKLQKVIELQEQLLKMKDFELTEVRKQRDWLQERIEKLETKAERDQLLLLSETRTVQKLLEIQQKRRSPIVAALEWFGIKNQQNQGDTFEVQKNTDKEEK